MNRTKFLVIASLAASALACSDDPGEGVSVVDGEAIPDVFASAQPGQFALVFDPATGELERVQATPNALQVIDEGSGPDQAEIVVVGFDRDGDCGFANSACLEVELRSYFANDTLSDAQAVLTSLSGNTSVLNSDLSGLGGWLYGDVAPSDSCETSGPTTRSWVFDTSAGGRISFVGEIRSLVDPVSPENCTGGDCAPCDGCSCLRDCSGAGSCDAQCVNGSTCTVDAANAGTIALQCEDSSCDFSCRNANRCETSCAGVSSCELSCGSLSTCFTACEDSSACTAECSNANRCSMLCSDDSTCEYSCQNFNTCIVTCEDNADCTQTCDTQSNCDLNCLDDAACLLQCPGGNRCDLNCSGTLTDCGGNLFACNRSCPGS